MKSFIQAIVWPAVFAVGFHLAAIISAVAGASTPAVAALSMAGITSSVLSTRAR